MTKDVEKLTSENAIRATNSVLGLLPQIASFVVGFSALAYICGWREVSAYYQELGAPWVLSLLSPSQIMQTSIWLISLIALICFLTTLQLIQGYAGQKGLRRWSIIFLAIALFLYAVPLVLEGHITSSTASTLVIATSVSWAISAGLTIGELIACLAQNNLRWGEYHMHLLYFIVLYGLFQAPSNMGTSRAQLASDPMFSKLPAVSFKLPGNTGEWRLVGPIGDRLLLLSIARKKEDRRFKLTTTDDINEIYTRSAK